VGYLIWVLFDLLLFSTVKIWKSLRFWQIYQHQLGGPVYYRRSQPCQFNV